MGNYGLQAKPGRDIVIVMVVFLVISVISVVLRLLSRRMLNLGLALDDYLIVVAMVFVIANTVLVITTVTAGGVGIHVTEVAFTDVEYVLKAIIPMQGLYGIGLALVKTSMMALYWRLFGSRTGFRIAVYAVGAFVWGWGLSIFLEAFLMCTPFEYNWDPTLPNGKCANRNAAFVAAGVLNMITDLLVLSLPVTNIWKLQLKTGQKVGLIFVFGLGLFISAISMVRVVSLMNVNFEDVTYSLPMPLMWSIVEEQLALTTANLPLLRHVFSYILPRGWLSSRRTSNLNRNSQYRKDDSRRQDEQNGYGLTPLTHGVHHSDVTASKNQADAVTLTADDSDTELAPHVAPLDGIHVRQDFRVGAA